MTPAAERYEDLMRKLLRLINAGLGDADEADTFRAQMDREYDVMDADERTQLVQRPRPSVVHWKGVPR